MWWMSKKTAVLFSGNYKAGGCRSFGFDRWQCSGVSFSDKKSIKSHLPDNCGDMAKTLLEKEMRF